MFSRIRKTLTYPSIAIMIVFVFACTSGAYAADKYLITSTQQISPQVLSQLSSEADSFGKDHKPLGSGKSEIGVWGFATHSAGLVREAISFPIPFAVPIEEDNVEVVEPGQEGKQDAKECPGTVEKPAAAAGYMCLYSARLEVGFFGDGPPRSGGIVLAFIAFTEPTGFGGAMDEGTWAITAP